ncbi:MAG TPA: 50S ribosomal protein L7ae [Syntrophomonadaceae bacterium]|nr:50S ribosomal protein L7ae [Syntrophomonadaceae bacterium]
MNSPLALLGLAKRAGKLASGMTNCLHAIRNKQAKLIIIAKDAGVNKKKIIRVCLAERIKYVEYGTKDEYRRILGCPSCFWAILSRELSQGFLAQIQRRED